MTCSEERSIKLARVRELIEKLGFDALYCKRQDDFAWLTCGGINYVGLGEMGNCGLLITRENTYAITNCIEAPRMRDEEHLEEMGFELHYGVWHDDAFEQNALRSLVPSGKICFDYGGASGPNVANDVKLLRFSLTEAEVARYQEGGFLTARAIEETLATARPGDSENDLIGRLVYRIRKRGMDVVSAMCAADERIYKYRHPVPHGDVIRERVQLGGNFRYRGLIICCTRLLNFVPVTQQLREQYLANVEIDCTLMANSIPGHTFVSALEAGRAAYAARGYAAEFDKHHQGGPIGYAGRDYRVGFNTPGVIAAHQAFCWDPSITGTKSEDTVIATSAGIIPVSRPILFPTLSLTVCGQKFVRPAIWEV